MVTIYGGHHHRPPPVTIEPVIFSYKPRSYTTVFVSLFVFVLIVAITFLIGLGILTDGFKHLTVEERCRERWTTKPSLTAFSSNSRESNQQFPHSRPILPSSNGINLPLPSLPPSSPPSSSLQQPSQQIKSFSTNTNSNSNVCLTPDCVRIGKWAYFL
uniref:Uncharacterized protein n=1 Tax=Panagrolaimus sp. PS1159 TaxID=55785 RepID=A0AC35F166_9BILA